MLRIKVFCRRVKCPFPPTSIIHPFKVLRNICIKFIKNIIIFTQVTACKNGHHDHFHMGDMLNEYKNLALVESNGLKTFKVRRQLINGLFHHMIRLKSKCDKLWKVLNENCWHAPLIKFKRNKYNYLATSLLIWLPLWVSSF